MYNGIITSRKVSGLVAAATAGTSHLPPRHMSQRISHPSVATENHMNYF